MTVTLRLGVGVVGMALVGLVACGGSTKAKSNAATPSSQAPSSSASLAANQGTSSPATAKKNGALTACSLVSQSDAATISGDSSITSSSASIGGICLFTDPGQPAIAGNNVLVEVEGPLPQVNAQLLQSAAAQRGGSGANLHAVPGIGDLAYAGEETGGGVVVFAKANRLVIIGGGSKTRSSSDVVASIETVAKRVAAQL